MKILTRFNNEKASRANGNNIHVNILFRLWINTVVRFVVQARHGILNVRHGVRSFVRSFIHIHSAFECVLCSSQRNDNLTGLYVRLYIVSVNQITSFSLWNHDVSKQNVPNTPQRKNPSGYTSKLATKKLNTRVQDRQETRRQEEDADNFQLQYPGALMGVQRYKADL